MQRCPRCDAEIYASDINIKEGVALCPACSTLSRLSELRDSDVSVDQVLHEPPHGCLLETSGDAVVATASARSIGTFLGCTAVALFWNGIVSVFVMIALAGLYTNLIGPLPDWFPAPPMNQGKPEMNGEPMGLGMTLFMCLFLTPFVAIGASMIWAAILSLFGKVEVVIDEHDSFVGIGVGFVRWKRRFDPRQTQSVEIHEQHSRSSDHNRTTLSIELIADRTIRFGSMLPRGRKQWLHTALQAMLLGDARIRRQVDLPELFWLDQRY